MSGESTVDDERDATTCTTCTTRERPAMPVVLIVHAFVTLALVGLIWTIQIVHYPLFARVGRAEFIVYEAEHARRMMMLVGPLMVVEAALAMALFVWPTPGRSASLTWIGLALVVVLWTFTFLVSVPCHNRLARGFDAPTHRRLVRTNWIRTAAWTVRGVIAFAMLG